MRLGQHHGRFAPALNAVAFNDLLAELDTQVIFRAPGNAAEAQRRLAVKAQPEHEGHFLGQRHIEQRPVLRQVTHHAGHVLVLVGIKPVLA